MTRTLADIVNLVSQNTTVEATLPPGDHSLDANAQSSIDYLMTVVTDVVPEMREEHLVVSDKVWDEFTIALANAQTLRAYVNLKLSELETVITEDLLDQLTAEAEPEKDDPRCWGSSHWLFGVNCLPKPQCIAANFHSPSSPLNGSFGLGWCVDATTKFGNNSPFRCLCVKKRIPTALVVFLLAVALYFFSPAAIGAIQTLAQQMAQRAWALGL